MMTERNIRMILFLVYFSAWGFVQNYFSITIFSGEIYQIILLTLVLTLAVLVLFVEHFFTKPSDVLTSSIAILLMLSPLSGELRELGWLYQASIYYALLMAVLAFTSLFFYNDQSPQNLRNKISSTTKWFAVNFLTFQNNICVTVYFNCRTIFKQ